MKPQLEFSLGTDVHALGHVPQARALSCRQALGVGEAE